MKRKPIVTVDEIDFIKKCIQHGFDIYNMDIIRLINTIEAMTPFIQCIATTHSRFGREAKKLLKRLGV